VEAEWPIHIIIGESGSSSSTKASNMERAVDILEEHESSPPAPSVWLSWATTTASRVIRLCREHGDVGETVALQEYVDGLHEGNPLVGCPGSGTSPQRVNRSAAGKPERRLTKFSSAERLGR